VKVWVPLASTGDKTPSVTGAARGCWQKPPGPTKVRGCDAVADQEVPVLGVILAKHLQKWWD
jgi:hypothetical protein